MEITIQVGKQGPFVAVDRIKAELRQRRDVRVRFLKSALKEDRKVLAEELFKAVGLKGKLIGNVVKFTPADKKYL